MYLKAFFASWTIYRVSAFFDRQAQGGLTILAFAVAADLAVAELVMHVCKEIFYTLHQCKKFAVFFAALVYVCGQIAQKCNDKYRTLQ